MMRKLILHVKNNESATSPVSHENVNSRWMKDLNVKSMH